MAAAPEAPPQQLTELESLQLKCNQVNNKTWFDVKNLYVHKSWYNISFFKSSFGFWREKSKRGLVFIKSEKCKSFLLVTIFTWMKEEV